MIRGVTHTRRQHRCKGHNVHLVSHRNFLTLDRRHTSVLIKISATPKEMWMFSCRAKIGDDAFAISHLLCNFQHSIENSSGRSSIIPEQEIPTIYAKLLHYVSLAYTPNYDLQILQQMLNLKLFQPTDSHP